MPEIVVVHAVDLPVDLIGSRPVQRAKAAYVIAAKTRCDADHLGKVTPVQRNVLHHVVGNRHRLRLRGGIKGESRRRNFDSRGLLLQL